MSATPPLPRVGKAEIPMLVGVDWGGTKIEATAIADEGELSQDCGKRHHSPTTRAAWRPFPPL
jgi:predicted NBD/HSP70 family sugar kinase